jgi:hypothetical protein
LLRCQRLLHTRRDLRRPRRHRHSGQERIRLRLPEATRTALRPRPIKRGLRARTGHF